MKKPKPAKSPIMFRGWRLVRVAPGVYNELNLRSYGGVMDFTTDEAAELATDLPRLTGAKSVPTFDEVWAQKKREGYSYGSDALEQVRFGWRLAMAALGGAPADPSAEMTPGDAGFLARCVAIATSSTTFLTKREKTRAAKLAETVLTRFAIGNAKAITLKESKK
jgi:hypothetical protein